MAVFDDKHEEARLEALRRVGVLNSEPEPELEQIARRAAEACGTPIGLVTFLTGDKQWIKGAVGADLKEIDRDASFCAWAVYNAEVLFVEDATRDDRFRDNPLVLQDPHIRFYAGAPVASPQGFMLGAVCVVDHEPRPLQEENLEILKMCAQEVSDLLDRRIRAESGEGAGA